MEVFFLDVAQGTCQVILVGDHRAIVLDCGVSEDQLVVQFLQRMGVERLDRLIVSHSHNDHIGGAVSVLNAFRNSIDQICFVQDDRFLETPFWKRISEMLQSKVIAKDQMVRLEASGSPQLIWKESATKARLRTYSPSAAENLLAQDAEKPNPTSAVLFLDVCGHRIIFSADSDASQWREIHRKNNERRMDCRILAVPHHAGKSHSSSEELDWLFDNAISADIAVVSVGTSNRNRHPRADVIEALTRRGTKVLCTQITSRCHPDLETLRPGVLNPVIHFGRSSPIRDVTSSGNSRNVACAGTVRAEITESGFFVDRLEEHQRSVTELAAGGHSTPLCRNACRQ